jgi:hypothetical protein
MGIIIVVCVIIFLLVIQVFRYLSAEDDVVIKKDELSIESLHLPDEIEKMTEFLISSIVRKIYDVFIKFGYNKVSEEKLLEKEWHTWQVSMILKLYKYNQEFYIANKEKVFHRSILDLNLKSLESLARSILLKYETSVRISKSKDDLCKDVIWTSREVSILFCYLSKYREL